jgi:hypothetical protein
VSRGTSFTCPKSPQPVGCSSPTAKWQPAQALSRARKIAASSTRGVLHPSALASSTNVKLPAAGEGAQGDSFSAASFSAMTRAL